MNQVWNIARKEFSDGLRNRWLLAISLLFGLFASTVLTLVVIPVLYFLYLARKEELKTAH